MITEELIIKCPEMWIFGQKKEFGIRKLRNIVTENGSKGKPKISIVHLPPHAFPTQRSESGIHAKLAPSSIKTAESENPS